MKQTIDLTKISDEDLTTKRDRRASLCGHLLNLKDDPMNDEEYQQSCCELNKIEVELQKRGIWTQVY